jgi:hypothetical protein
MCQTTYTPYLEERWSVGETNGRQLWHEIQAQGFSGSLALVARWARRQRMLAPPPAPVSPRIGRPPVQRSAPRRAAPLATRQVVWWLLRTPEALKLPIQGLLEKMEQVSPAFGALKRLAQAFTQMLRARQVEQLDTWLEQASSSVSRIGQLRDRYQARLCCGESGLALALQHRAGRGQHQSAEVNQEKYVWQSEFRLAASTGTGRVSSASPRKVRENRISETQQLRMLYWYWNRGYSKFRNFVPLVDRGCILLM